MVKSFQGFVVTKKLFDVEFRIEEGMKVLVGDELPMIAEIEETSPKLYNDGFVKIKLLNDDERKYATVVHLKELRILALINVSTKTNRIFTKAIDISYPLPIAESQWGNLIDNKRYDNEEAMDYGIIYKVINPYESNIRLHKHSPLVKLIITRDKNPSWDNAVYNAISIIGNPNENESPLDYLGRIKVALEKLYTNPKKKK